MRKAIIHLKKKDPVLRSIIERVGPYRMEFMEPQFATLVRSIVYQQLSGKVASVIYNRLLEAAGGMVTPRSILKLTPARLRKIGLSRQKSAYILDLAKHTHQGTVVFETIHLLSDNEVIEHLTVVKGIGVWTAHMFLMFALRRIDVLPTGESGSPHGYPQSLRTGRPAQARRNRSHRRRLAPLLFRRGLVPLAQPGHQDLVK